MPHFKTVFFLLAGALAVPSSPARAINCADLLPTDSIGWLDGKYCEAVGTWAREFDTRNLESLTEYGSSQNFLNGALIRSGDPAVGSQPLLYVFAWYDTENQYVIPAGTSVTFRYQNYNGPSLRAVDNGQIPVDFHLYVTQNRRELLGTIGDFVRASQGTLNLRIREVQKP